MKKWIVILLSSAALTGCGESKDEYIGTYSYVKASTGKEILAEIKKDGESYFFVENIDRPSQILALGIEDDGLVYNGKLLKLSSDQSKLYFAGITADKISEPELNEWKKKRDELAKICDKIQVQIDQEIKQKLSNSDWNEYVREVRATAPDDCNLKGLNLKW
ncbi:hypothetical protein [Shewanella indica]|uniref:hypothetical protein n=1 Tax=Shewanella indica TaxID=768528 RepID=UPI00399ADCFA